MKLYTEEDIKQVINLSRESYGYDGYKFDENEIFKELTPIEMPSDEDLEKAQKEEHLTMEEMCRFEEGVEWMIKQINNQNK